MSLEAARAELAANGGAVEISYGDFGLLVQRCDFVDARKEVAKVPPEDRQPIMQSVDEELRKNFKIVEAGKATKEIFDAVYADMMIWTALQEYTA